MKPTAPDSTCASCQEQYASFGPLNVCATCTRRQHAALGGALPGAVIEARAFQLFVAMANGMGLDPNDPREIEELRRMAIAAFIGARVFREEALK